MKPTCFLLAFLSLNPFGLAAGAGRSPDQTPEGLAPSDWSSIRAAYEAGRHAFQPSEDGGYTARNPGQQWTAKFDGRGFLAQPLGGGWQWGLELRGYGFAGQERSRERPAMVTAQGQRLVWAWDGCLEEWLINDQRGLEHGFTLRKRPTVREVLDCGSPLPLSVPTLDCGSLLPLSVSQPAARQPGEALPTSQSHPRQQAALSPKRQQAAAVQEAPYLQFTLAVRGGLRPEIASDAKTVRFLDADGTALLKYSGLKVWDATGRDLPAHFEATDSPQPTLRLLVDERDAVYPITIDPIAQQAYLKASQVSAGDEFGYSVAVSGDTVVVGATAEDSSTTGSNSTPNEGAADAGAAYVFVHSGTTWSQQAYLKASQVTADDRFGSSVAISGDTVVVGAHWEDGSATGVNGPADEAVNSAGAAYVFVRSGTMWSQQAYLKASQVSEFDYFGYSVAISGDTVVVGAPWEDGATGVNGPVDEAAQFAGATYVFVRNGTTWSQQAYLKASEVSAVDQFGWSVAVSGDTVVVGAIGEAGSATGVNGTPDEGSFYAGAAYVFVRSGTTWSQQAYLKASQVSEQDWFGESVAVSRDTVVVGTGREDGSATGVNGTPDELASEAGAAYVFVRNGTTWSQQAYLKACQVTVGDFFGESVAVSGDTVVVGAPYENGSATGVNGTVDELANQAGAAYVFVRSGTTWSQQAYLKPGAVGSFQNLDGFGQSVAVWGSTVVVGAPNESGSATGVNGTPDELAYGAGAAYVFTGLGPPLLAWRQEQFGTPNNSGTAANDFDFEADGWKNLLEYGLVTDPHAHGESGITLGVSNYSGSEYLRAVFTRDPTRYDVTIRVEVADSPAGLVTIVASSVNGAAMSGAGLVSETDLPGGLKQVEVRDTVPTSAAARRFLRIVVEE